MARSAASSTRVFTRFRAHSVLPGFNLAMGFTLLYLSLIVLVPLSALFFKTANLG